MPHVSELALPLAVASLRIVGAIALIPLGTLASGRGAWLARLLVAAPLCLVAWPVTVPSLLASPIPLAALAARELVIGLAIGAAAAIVLSVGRLAGGLLDTQLPSWRASSLELGAGPLAGLLALTTLVLFVTLDGHVVLFEALLTSYTHLPITPDSPALAPELTSLAARLVEQAAAVFAIAAAAILPAVAAAALAEGLVGLVRRFALAPASTPGAPAIRVAVLVVALLATLHALLALLARWMLATLA